MGTVEDRQCYQCAKWKYNDMIEKKYGEGTGLCGTEPRGCNRTACVCFVSREDNVDVE